MALPSHLLAVHRTAPAASPPASLLAYSGPAPAAPAAPSGRDYTVPVVLGMTGAALLAGVGLALSRRHARD